MAALLPASSIMHNPMKWSSELAGTNLALRAVYKAHVDTMLPNLPHLLLLLILLLCAGRLWLQC